ncbi:MAG: hypothetical protein HY738_03225 [Bacteroidia bacterium]|nr:hypothetical protein [Bacteroidia bacterium]
MFNTRRTKHIYLNCIEWLIIFILINPFSVFAQEEDTITEDWSADTYLLKDSINITGFLSPFINGSGIINDIGFSVGGAGAIVFADHYFVGGYGFALLSDIYIRKGSKSGKGIEMTHGGIYVGYNFLQKNRIQLGFSAQFGWGGIALTSPGEKFYVKENTDKFFILSPAIYFDRIITSKLSASFVFTYNFFNDIDIEEHTDRDFSGPGVSLMIKVGKFYYTANGVN